VVVDDSGSAERRMRTTTRKRMRMTADWLIRVLLPLPPLQLAQEWSAGAHC
jgi:hypothetical protein